MVFLLPVDEKLLPIFNGRVSRRGQCYTPCDADAVYDRVTTYHLTDSAPVARCIRICRKIQYPAFESGHIKIDHVVGSCTNGRLEDLQQAAEVMQGRKVHPHVRVIIIPATQEITKKLCLGYIDFIDAGAQFLPYLRTVPGVVMLGILLPGERAVSTTNRTSAGRKGHVDSEVHLASPMWRLPVRSQAISQAQRGNEMSKVRALRRRNL